MFHVDLGLDGLKNATRVWDLSGSHDDAWDAAVVRIDVVRV